MSIQSPPPLPPIITEAAAADYLGVSRRFLQKHRAAGTGPRYVKLPGRHRGGAVRYRAEDIAEWLESKEVKSGQGCREVQSGPPPPLTVVPMVVGYGRDTKANEGELSPSRSHHPIKSCHHICAAAELLIVLAAVHFEIAPEFAIALMAALRRLKE